METAVALFLGEVTAELLYNIVHNKNSISNFNLLDEFKKKTGHEPMEFFGYGNETGYDLLGFINVIPGLKVEEVSAKMICTRDDSDEVDGPCAYKMFNTTYMSQVGVNKISVAGYREKLLIKCCELMKVNFDDLSSCTDLHGNTPFHLLAALPYDTTLVKYLLQADVDPLKENSNGQTFLHVMFGRFVAKIDSMGVVYFKNERVATARWFQKDLKAVLNLISKKLSKPEITFLVKAQDTNGNTVLHEYALSTTMQQELFQERKICKELLNLIDATRLALRIPNSKGEVPLHYASNPSVFKIFVEEEEAVCRARNDRDETPVLFILKMSVELAFAKTSVSTELENQGFVQITSSRSVEKAVELLENLTSIVAENMEARQAVFIPDIQGNVAIDVVLVAIRIGSYDLNGLNRLRAPVLQSLLVHLVELLSQMLRDGNARDIKRQNKKDQSFLHILLDMGNENEHKVSTGTNILKSAKILLQHGVDVNVVDSEGFTPLDIALKHRNKGPTLYNICSKLLIENGAVSKGYLANELAIIRGMSSLGISDVTRKLRSCPKRHLNCAERLTVPTSDPDVVGRYRYFSQDSIGSGAFSVIFVAIKDENVDNRSSAIECRAYALKRIVKARLNPREIKREITTLLSISGKCENIIKYHESFDDRFFQYLSLDLMDGDLNEFVENSDVNSALTLDAALPVQVTNGIVSGLAFLHEKGYIHRDLKPGNVLYITDPSLHFKIADFGLTKDTTASSTMTSTRGVGMVPGTRCWMAPELVSMKSREHTQQSDIFSLGMVLHYLLTIGKHPFAKRREGKSHVIERKIEEMQIHLDKALHPEVASFLRTLLTRDPIKRPPAAYLNQHPYLWTLSKKIEFLKAVGDQPEAVSPANSPLEKLLQKTHTGKEVMKVGWNQAIMSLFMEMITKWKHKKYRTNKLIDLVRFIRNSYSHRQERSSAFQEDLDDNIFLREFPSLVLDAFDVVQQLGFAKNRSNIREALSL